MKYLSLILLVAVVLSCSKPTQEGAATDSTAAAQTPTDTTTPADNSLKLTPEELERVHMEIFLWLHEAQTFNYDNAIVAFKEEYLVDGYSFDYSLIRDNGSRAGQYQGDDGNPYPEPSFSEVDQTPRTDKERAELDSVRQMEEDAIGYSDPYTWQAYVIEDLDTVAVSQAEIKAYVELPETRVIRLTIIGDIIWENFKYMNYGEVVSVGKRDGFPSMVINLDKPLVLSRDQLYLKAKIAQLTDDDLAGMNKDELGILRNEIFARHGHVFKTDKMKKYFNPKEWYNALIDDATPLLNAIEKKNVDFIKKKEG